MQSFLTRLRRGELGAAAVLIGGGILVSRVLGIVRDMVFASLLGANAVTDEYVAAFRIPDFANYLLAGGFLTITFIPIFAGYLARDDEEGGWVAFTVIIRWLTIAISLLIVVAWMFTPTIIPWLYGDFTPDQIASTVWLTRILLPAQLAFVVGAMFAAVQYAKGTFVIPTLAPIVYNLGIITGGVWFAASTGEASPEGFVWGALAGAFIGNFALQMWGAHRVGMKVSLRAPWRHRAIVTYLTIAVPLMIGQSIVALDEVFMSVFGSKAGAGAQTHLQYARRTMFVPIGIIAQAAAVATYPTLARMFAEGNRAGLLRTVNKAMRTVITLSIGAAALMAAVSLPAIRVLFERGSFTAQDTIAASSALFMYAFGIPIWGALQIITRAFYARKQMWTPVLVGSGITLLAIPMYGIMQSTFGIEGVAATSVITLGLYTAILMGVWYNPSDARAGLGPMLGGAGRALPLAIPGAAGAGVVASLFLNALPDAPAASAVIALCLALMVFVTIVLVIGGVFGEWLLKRPAPRATDSTVSEQSLPGDAPPAPSVEASPDSHGDTGQDGG